VGTSAPAQNGARISQPELRYPPLEEYEVSETLMLVHHLKRFLPFQRLLLAALCGLVLFFGGAAVHAQGGTP
jgi:hypothetical protein